MFKQQIIENVTAKFEEAEKKFNKLKNDTTHHNREIRDKVNKLTSVDEQLLKLQGEHELLIRCHETLQDRIKAKDAMNIEQGQIIKT